MKILFSPTKKQGLASMSFPRKTEFLFTLEYEQLREILLKMSISDFEKMLRLSKEKAVSVKKDLEKAPARVPALGLFQGVSFSVLDLQDYNELDFEYAQKHLCILSGLFGLVSPLDQITPYRLDFNDRFPGALPFRDIRSFWGQKILDYFAKEDVIVNLASSEYSLFLEKAYPEKMKNIFFVKDAQSLKPVHSVLLKKERGRLLNYMIKNRCTDISFLSEYTSEQFVFYKNILNNYYFITRE